MHGKSARCDLAITKESDRRPLRVADCWVEQEIDQLKKRLVEMEAEAALLKDTGVGAN